MIRQVVSVRGQPTVARPPSRRLRVLFSQGRCIEINMWEPTVGQGVNVNVAHTFEGGAGNGWVLEELNAETEEDEEDEAAVADEDDAWLPELAELASISSPSPLVEMVGSAVLVLTAAVRRPVSYTHLTLPTICSV